MKRLLIASMAALACPAWAPAKARSLGAAPLDCALEAQRAVARRHHLGTATDGSTSMRIYADPKMAQEADDAFDACVRRQPAS